MTWRKKPLKTTYRVLDDTWVSKEGDECLVAEMEDEHLLNCHRLMREWKRYEYGHRVQVDAAIGRLGSELQRRGLTSRAIRLDPPWLQRLRQLQQQSGNVVTVAAPSEVLDDYYRVAERPRKLRFE